MKNKTLRWLILIGSLAILTNFGIQLYLLYQAFNEGQKKFSQTVHIVLLEVLKKMYSNDLKNMPQTSPVRKLANDYFVVDVNDIINANVLEFYLKSELDRFGIQTDFEYGIYDCETDKMVYGNYIYAGEDTAVSLSALPLPRHPGLVYYFGLRFPHQKGYIAGTLRIWILFTAISATILLFFVYVIFMVLRQRRFSELQRDFINNMTHEFKTPLTSNRIAIEYLQNNESIRSDARMKKYCDLLAMQNEHLNNQVERILQTSQMEKRFFPLETKIIILDLLIEKVLDTFRIDPAIEFLFEKKETGMCVLADEIHFTNALYSIVDNARKYGLGKSPVTVKLEKTGKHIKVRVIDKGPGIEKKHIRHIYHKFYRVATGDIHNVKGFGLGLFYVKKVCDRHGWKINVNSVPGEGTEVEITMPEYVQER